MAWLKGLWNLFPQPVVEDSEESQKARSKKIVSSLANGNVSLRAGRYLTSSDIAEKRKQVVRHKYV